MLNVTYLYVYIRGTWWLARPHAMHHAMQLRQPWQPAVACVVKRFLSKVTSWVKVMDQESEEMQRSEWAIGSMISPKKSQRQEATVNPGRSKVRRHTFSGCVHAIPKLLNFYARYYAMSLAELHFFMQWEEDQDNGESLYDVLRSKSIVADDPLAVVEGQTVCIFQEENLPSCCCWKLYILFFFVCCCWLQKDCLWCLRYHFLGTLQWLHQTHVAYY